VPDEQNVPPRGLLICMFLPDGRNAVFAFLHELGSLGRRQETGHSVTTEQRTFVSLSFFGSTSLTSTTAAFLDGTTGMSMSMFGCSGFSTTATQSAQP
jgi:hypothetical protein